MEHDVLVKLFIDVVDQLITVAVIIVSNLEEVVNDITMYVVMVMRVISIDKIMEMVVLNYLLSVIDRMQMVLVKVIDDYEVVVTNVLDVVRDVEAVEVLHIMESVGIDMPDFLHYN